MVKGRHITTREQTLTRHQRETVPLLCKISHLQKLNWLPLHKLWFAQNTNQEAFHETCRYLDYVTAIERYRTRELHGNTTDLHCFYCWSLWSRGGSLPVASLGLSAHNKSSSPVGALTCSLRAGRRLTFSLSPFLKKRRSM